MYTDPGVLLKPYDYITRKAAHELKMKAEFEQKQDKRIKEEREWVSVILDEYG